MPDHASGPPNDSDCQFEWPVARPDRDGHDYHECAEGDRCWRKSIHECWCGATIEKDHP